MNLFWKKTKETESSPQQFIIITGCAGSGKTTIGKNLARKLGYCYIDKDTVTREYTDFILKASGSYSGDRESPLYRNKILPIEYRVTFKLCREILENGCSVVLTIPFISQIQDISKWEEIKQQAKINTENIKFIWIEHNIDTEHANIINRNAARDKYKLEHWEEYAESVEDLYPAPEYKAYVCNNDCNINIDITINDIIQWIRK